MSAVQSTIGGVIVAVFLLGLLLGNGFPGAWLRLRAVFTHKRVNVALTAALVAVALMQWVVYNRQAKIMEAQTHISEETQRAFIYALPLAIEPVKDKDGLIWSWDASPYVENSGSTPARNVIVETGMSHWIPESHPGEQRPVTLPDLTSDNPTYRKTSVVLGPHAKARLAPFGLANPKAADAMAGTHINPSNISAGNWSMFIQAVVNYDDVFNKHHVTKVCFASPGGPPCMRFMG